MREIKVACPNNPRGLRKGHRFFLSPAEYSRWIEEGWGVPPRQNLAGHKCPDGATATAGVEAITPEDTPCTSRIPANDERLGTGELGAEEENESPELGD